MVTALDRAVEEMQRNLSGGQAEVQAQMAGSVTELKEAMRQLMAEMAEARGAQTRSAEQDMAAMRQSMESLLEQIKVSGERAAADYGRSIGGALDKVQGGIDEFLKTSEARQSASDEKTAALLRTLDERMAVLLDSARSGAEAMRDNTRTLNEVATRAVDGMNRGAETMRVAADRFTSAGDRVTSAIDQSADLQSRIQDAARGLESSGRALAETVAAYERTRGSVEAMTATLRQVADDATRRADLSRAVVDDMTKLVQRFEQVQQQTGDYLDKVSKVLQTGFDEFSSAVIDNMGKVRGEFHKDLSQAVGMISGQLDELDSVLNRVTERV
jgi:putative membrane protein